MAEHEILGVKFDSRQIDYLAIKRDGLTVTIKREEEHPARQPSPAIKGFAGHQPNEQS